MSLTLRFIITVFFTTVYFLQSGVRSFILGENTKCYRDLGCFSSGYPFRSPTRPISTVPSSPDHIRTLFILYTRDKPQKGQELDARKYIEAKSTWKHFKNRPTKIIVHGFFDDINIVSWLEDMKSELLNHGDYNVIIVDWHHGNLLPYTQATANTRVVGAQLAVLILQLQKEFKVTPDQFHIIGHSLGAHIAGYAGERVKGLGRISGLDPAGPYFSGTDKVVRLDPSDALFVDTIHSDGVSVLRLGLGMSEPVGDMDFYPNLGHDQPGCEKDVFNLLNILLKQGITDVIACNHLRSIKLFTESINTKCPFRAVPCDNENDFKQNKCHGCTEDRCASMGFKADKGKLSKGIHMKYYTSTAPQSPYCLYHSEIRIRLASPYKASEERGIMKVRLHGTEGNSEWLPLFKHPVVYYPGLTYGRTIELPEDFGRLSSVDFKWHHQSSLTNPWKWNLFGLRNPKLYLHELDVVSENGNKVERFCASDNAVENDEVFSLYKRCEN